MTVDLCFSTMGVETEMATHSSIAWRIPWTEEPSRGQSMGSQRVGHDLVTYSHAHSLTAMGDFAPLGAIWQCLETFSVVTAVQVPLALVGRG